MTSPNYLAAQQTDWTWVNKPCLFFFCLFVLKPLTLLSAKLFASHVTHSPLTQRGCYMNTLRLDYINPGKKSPPWLLYKVLKTKVYIYL